MNTNARTNDVSLFEQAYARLTPLEKALVDSIVHSQFALFQSIAETQGLTAPAAKKKPERTPENHRYSAEYEFPSDF